MKKYIVLFLPCLFLFSCSQNKNKDTATVSNTADSTKSTDDVAFFPVTSFLQNEIQALDSLPVTILQVTTINKKQDSTWLTAAQVKPKLQPFITDVIDKHNLEAYFKETKFNDQGTEAITFMYDPKVDLADSFSLRRWDVYINPENNALKRVYMVKRVKENNMPVTQQLTWQSGKWAKIVTIMNDPKTTAQPTEIKWVWDLSE